MKTVLGSLARIADFDTEPYEVGTVNQQHWETGDYVLAEVVGDPSGFDSIEDCTGEMIPVRDGDQVLGAFGDRAATLEGVGSWTDIRDGKMEAMTSAGLFGAYTSFAMLLPRPITLKYCGHIVREGKKMCMRTFALQCKEQEFRVPTVFLVGTSMNSGKTTTGRVACKVLADLGLKVFGAKLTGAGRLRDILSFKAAGAVEIFDFVDVGLPSTVVPESVFRTSVRPLLWHIQSRQPDVLIAEAGASPLEPYNGAAAIDEVGDNIRCTILCASDPYAVVGVQRAFDFSPDLVAGPAANTSAATALVKKLSGRPSIDLLDPDSIPEFRRFLETKLDHVQTSSS